MKKFFVFCFLFSFLFVSCSKNENKEEEIEEIEIEIPLSIYQKIYKTTADIYIQDGFAYINTNGVPDHKSPYFPVNHELYESYDGSNPFVSNFKKNPNGISTLSLRFKIPNKPKKASFSGPTPLGPIGVSLNGIPFYNQYAGPDQPLTREINSFDQFNGHPAPLGPGLEDGVSGRYHYHMEPFWITQNKGKDALIGFLLDGFPVYGPVENGNPIYSVSLDEYHGHTHPTSEFPEGIYHYHVTPDDPYINGSGFYGVPGTVNE